MNAPVYPVIYGPDSRDIHVKVAEPMGHATTERGALSIAGRKLVRPASFERRVVKLCTYPDLYGDGEGNYGPDVVAWSVCQVMR